jgi:hypothetical protein
MQLLKQGIAVKAATRNVGIFDSIKSAEHLDVFGRNTSCTEVNSGYAVPPRFGQPRIAAKRKQ